MKKVVMGYCDL